jgi:hypothetical protein
MENLRWVYNKEKIKCVQQNNCIFFKACNHVIFSSCLKIVTAALSIQRQYEGSEPEFVWRASAHVCSRSTIVSIAGAAVGPRLLEGHIACTRNNVGHARGMGFLFELFFSCQCNRQRGSNNFLSRNWKWCALHAFIALQILLLMSYWNFELFCICPDRQFRQEDFSERWKKYRPSATNFWFFFLGGGGILNYIIYVLISFVTTFWRPHPQKKWATFFTFVLTGRRCLLPS